MTDLPVIRGMRDVREVLRQRAAQLGIAFSTYDVIAGLPDGYASKLLGPDPLKNFGETSFDALLGAAALMLVPVEDSEALARINSRLKPLERAPSKRASPVQRTIRINKSFFKKIGRIGGQKSGVSRRRAVERRKAISERNRQNVSKRWHAPELVEIKP